MPLLPLLDRIEPGFAVAGSIKWCGEHWSIPSCAIACYLLLVFAGPRWMKNRPAYSLRLPLTMWSTGLAAFSVLGLMSLTPPFLEAISTGGLQKTVCVNVAMTRSHTALWHFLFLISKVAELGDTVFIVLRKSPLHLLHWYHHITVLVYSWYGYSTIVPNAIGIWFCGLNYFVHTAMYSYYAVKACGRKLPTSIAQCITILQLLQFFVALFCNVMAFWYKRSPGGEDCALHDNVFYMGMVIYGSYFVLFAHFFYRRYILPVKKSLMK